MSARPPSTPRERLVPDPALSTGINSLTDVLSDPVLLAEFVRGVIEAEIGIVLHGPDMRYCYWNHWMEKMSGVAATEVLGHSPQDFLQQYPFIQTSGMLDRLQAVLAGQEVEEMEYACQIGSGESRYVTDRARTLYNSAGQIVGVMRIIHDITERKHHEQIKQLYLQLDNYARDHTLVALLQETINEVGSLMDSPLGFFGLADPHRSQFIHHAWSTQTAQLLQSVPEAVVGGPDFCQLQYPQIFNKNNAEKGECWAVVPIIRQGSVIAILGVGGKKVGYNETDLVQLVSLAEVGLAIAERKITEEALRESERTKASIISNLPGFIYRCINDRNWSMALLSDGCKIITGYEPQDFIDNARLSFNDIIHPDYQETIWTQWQSVLENKSTFEEEYPIIAADGEIRWVWERGRGVFSEESGDLLYLEGFITDITRRKKVEENLRILEEKLRLAIQAAGMGDWYLDLKTNIRYYDETACQTLGVVSSEFQGQENEFFNVIHPDDLENVKQCLHDAVAHKKMYCPVFRTKDGRWLAVRGQVVCNDLGVPIQLHGVIWDITKEKNLDERAQLDHSQESLGVLVGGFAHDVNNSLQAIIGILQLIQLDHPEIAELQEAIDTALRIAELTRLLVSLRRSPDITKEKVEIVSVVQETIKFIEATNNCQIQKEIKVLPRTMVAANKTELHQVLVQILMNAIQALESKETKHADDYIKISMSNESLNTDHSSGLEKGDYIHLVIEDSGVGMTKSVLEKIFDPYFSTKERTSTKGMGLGLYIAYSKIRSYHGAVLVESKFGQGTSVHIYLPTAAYDASPAAESQQLEVLAPQGTILLVEDEELVRTMMKKLLMLEGYEVLVADNGVAGWQLWQKHHAQITATVLDRDLPQMNGGQVLDQIIEQDETAVVVMVSGHQLDVNLRGRYVDYLQKPFNNQTLLSSLATLRTKKANALASSTGIEPVFVP